MVLLDSSHESSHALHPIFRGLPQQAHQRRAHNDSICTPRHNLHKDPREYAHILLASTPWWLERTEIKLYNTRG